MRVKVTYSIDLEDVPLKVSSLIAEIHQDLKNSCELVANSSSLLGIENDPIKCIKDLDAAQDIIYSATQQLEDMKSILIGYQKILLSESESAQEVDEETYNTIQDMKNLVNQIKDIEELSND